MSAVRTEKPWGHELVLRDTGDYVVKILHVAASNRLSLQYHRVKRETLIRGSGEALIEVHSQGAVTVHRLGPPLEVPPGTVHRIVAVTDCDVVEVSSCELDDVVRVEDDYGRGSVTSLT